jgi:hypothetical protein
MEAARDLPRRFHLRARKANGSLRLIIDDQRRARTAESGGRMRRLLSTCLFVLGICASSSKGQAADYDFPTLRGSDNFVPAFAGACCR